MRLIGFVAVSAAVCLSRCVLVQCPGGKSARYLHTSRAVWIRPLLPPLAVRPAPRSTLILAGAGAGAPVMRHAPLTHFPTITLVSSAMGSPGQRTPLRLETAKRHAVRASPARFGSTAQTPPVERAGAAGSVQSHPASQTPPGYHSLATPRPTRRCRPRRSRHSTTQRGKCSTSRTIPSSRRRT